MIGMDDDAIKVVVSRLARKHPLGTVIERAAIMAEGSDADALMTWIMAHGGKPEVTAEKAVRQGLHGARMHTPAATSSRPPARFVLPVGALD